MERIEAVIKELYLYDVHWKDKIKSINDLPDIKEKVVRQAANIIVSELRELLKKNEKSSILSQLEERIGDPDIAEIFVNYAFNSLKAYFVMEPVRQMDQDKTVSFFTFLFKNYILRYNQNFAASGSQFGLEETVIEEIAKYMDFLVSYYIMNHYIRRSILEDFGDETGVEGEEAEAFADLIEENYHALQLNWIIDKLDMMSE